MKKTLKAALSVLMAVIVSFGTFSGTFGGIDLAFRTSAEGAMPEPVDSGLNWEYFGDGELRISGNVGGFTEENLPGWKDYLKQIKLISFVGSGVTAIGSNAFGDIDNVESIEIPATVKSIAPDAFDNMKSLKKIYFEISEKEWKDSKIYDKEEITFVFDHVHTNGQIKHALPADCKNEGWTGDTYCAVCKSYIKGGALIPNDDTKHIWSSERLIKEAATCSKQGTLAYQCIVCGAWKTDDTRPISPTGHHEFILKDEDKLMSCTPGGYVRYTCKYCDEVKFVTIYEHEFLYQVIDPTCEEEGYTTVTCRYCRYNQKKDVKAKLGHDASIPYETPATCTVGGEYGLKCSRCDKICEQTKTKPLGHEEGEWVVTKEPGCAETGIKELRCKRYDECEYVYETATVPNLHTEDSWDGTWFVVSEPDCMNEGIENIRCNVCGEIIKDDKGENVVRKSDPVPNSHKSSIWVTVIEPTCTTPGIMVKKCTVRGCKYHTDNKISIAIDKASREVAVKAILKSVNDELVEAINDYILKQFYSLSTPDNMAIYEIINDAVELEGIEDANDINTIATIISTASKKLAEEANVNNTKDTVRDIINKSFAEIGEAWIKEAVSAASEDDINLIKHITLDYQEIAADGHTYQTVCYYEDFDITGEHIYVPVVLENGSYYKISGFELLTDDNGKAILDRKGNEVYIPVGEGEAIDEAAHKIITGVDCNEGGTLVEMCRVCGEIKVTDVKKGSHSYVVETIPATCTEQGYTEQTCKFCTYDTKFDYTPSLSHKWKETVIKDSTCTKTGLKAEICENCGETNTQTYKPVELKKHDYSVAVVKPTCDTDGYTSYTCKVCGGGYKGDFVDKLGHDLIDTVVPVTCTTNGYTLHTCKVCKYEYKDTFVRSVGHQYGEEKKVEATCTADAYTQRICTVCKEELKIHRDGDDKKLGHILVDDEAIDPTCAAPGYTAGQHCDRCGFIAVPQQEIKPLSHTVAIDREVPATCSTDGLTAGSHCEICHQTIVAQQVIPATKHSVIHQSPIEATCETYGCTEGYYCEKCGEIFQESVLIPAFGHDYSDWAVEKEATLFSHGMNFRVCYTCGKVEKMETKLTFFGAIGAFFKFLFTPIIELIKIITEA